MLGAGVVDRGIIEFVNVTLYEKKSYEAILYNINKSKLDDHSNHHGGRGMPRNVLLVNFCLFDYYEDGLSTCGILKIIELWFRK